MKLDNNSIDKMDDENLKEVSFYANPDYSDYYHEVLLREDGRVDFFDGGCQMNYGHAQGTYCINLISETELEITFTNLVLTDPYDPKIIFTEMKSFSVITRKEKTFLKYGTTPVTNPDEFESYLYSFRFDKDPLEVFRTYCHFYDSKYIEDYSKEELKMFKEDSETYSENGIFMNKLETIFYFSEDRICL